MPNSEIDSASQTSSASSQYPSDPSPLTYPKRYSKEKAHKTPLIFFKTFKSFKTTSKSCSAQVPKKEYLRCKLIRGCKKCMRLLAQKKNPQKITKFKKMSPKIKKTWEKMLRFYQNNLETLEDFSKTDTTLSDKVYKSYNSKFCSRFFENPAVRRLFSLYVKLLFVDLDLARLSNEFNFSCCIERQHKNCCYAAWERLRDYILGKMVEEVIMGEFFVRSERVEGDESIEKIEKIEEKIEERVVEQSVYKFSVMRCLDLQPKWIQRHYLMDLHII